MPETEEFKTRQALRAVAIGTITAVLLLSVAGVAVWLQAATKALFFPTFAATVVIVGLAMTVGYFVSSSSTVLGFIARCKQDLDVLFPTPVDEDDLLRDTRRTRDAFLSIAILGFGAMFLYALQWTPVGFAQVFGGSLLVALASIAIGICIGFLFGIPRTLQADRTFVPPDARGGTAPAAPLPTTTAQLGVNTNLEQISDWLTKIIVGLGLINLEKLPQKFKAIASAAAPTVGGSRSFAAVIIVAYSVCGFMLGYLLTRLYLARAFVRAERAQEAAADIHRELERVGAEAAITTAPAAADTDPISPQQKVAAARVERLAMKTDADAVRLQVERLAREYERIRGSMSPGDARTRLMEIVAAQMRTLSLAGHELLPELIHSNTGERLAAVSFLEVKPSAEHLQWLVERMTEENPFVMYHAAWALRHAARVLPCSELDSVKSAITRAMTAAMGKDRGTESVLKQAATEASKRCLHEPAEE